MPEFIIVALPTGADSAAAAEAITEAMRDTGDRFVVQQLDKPSSLLDHVTAEMDEVCAEHFED